MAVKAPQVAWLIPLAALLAVIGAFTPWFKAKGTASAAGQTIHHTFDGLYSFKDGKIGLLAPILLVILAIGVVGLLLGRAPARFSRGSTHPVSYAGKVAIVAGVITLVCTIVAWFLVKTQYKFNEAGHKYSWDDYIKAAKAAGVKLELSRGPQIGYFLTIAAGVVAIIGGLLMVLSARGSAAPTSSHGYRQGGPPGSPQQAPAGYPQQAPAGYAPPPGGYQQAPPGGYQPPAGGYGQVPPAGYQQPPPGGYQQPGPAAPQAPSQ